MKFFFGALLLLGLNGTAQQVSSVPVQEFESGLSKGEVQLLDVRRPEEYKSGHLAGAFQADWTDKKQFEERVQYLDKSIPVYLYCLSGGRSGAAANWLAQNGFTAVINMEGGINAWKKEGRAVETNAVVPQMTEAEYNALLSANTMVLADFGAAWCPPCKKMEPVLQEIEKEHKELKLVRIDAGIQTDLMKYLKIEGLPVFILYKDGKEVWRQEGVADKTVLEKALQSSH
jgi:rhodanese-related sulfurtransferase